MNATFGVTPKTMNSTWRQMSSTITLNVKLKEKCSRHDPVFIVEGLNKLTRYNYCNWESGWYWIDDLVYVTNDIQEVHCRLDPMATFRDDIANVNGICVYGDADHWNDLMDDIRFGPDDLLSAHGGYKPIDMGTNFWAWDLSNSTVMLDVIETTPNSGFKKYALSYYQFQQLMYSLNTSTLDQACADVKAGHGAWSAITTQGAQDIATLISALGGSASWQECILGATWLPFNFAHVYNDAGNPQVTEIRIGAVKVPLTGNGCYQVKYPVKAVGGHQYINKSDAFISLLDDLRFVRNPRWLSVQLKTPGGIQVINDAILREDATWPLNINTDVDVVSGKWNMTITTNLGDTPKNGVVLAKFSGDMSMDLTQWLSNKGTGTEWVSNAMAKIIPAVLTNGASTVVDSVTTNDISTTDTSIPAYSAKGNPTGHYNMSTTTSDKSVTNTRSVTTGKKANPMSSIPTGMREFGAAGNHIIDYYCNNTDHNNGSGPALGISYLVLLWGPNSFIRDADPYEAYLDFCDDYGYPCNAYLQINDIADKSYVQMTDTFIQYIPGATEDDKKIINFFLNDGFIWERIET